MRVPIFLFDGILESGKSAFIQKLIEKPAFGDGELTLLICCEEGEIEYNNDILKEQNIVKVIIEEEKHISERLLKELADRYNPKRVIIEFNGMWNIDNLFDIVLPDNWALYQSVVIVNGDTFNLYMANMKSLFVEHFKIADLVVINRVNQTTDLGLLRGIVKTLTPECNILISSENFEVKPLEDKLPFDITGNSIEVKSEHYGYWYIDLWENKDHYIGKNIKISGLFFQSPSDPKDYFHFGRFAMPCCEDDITFLGVYCKNIGKPKFKNKDSINIEGKVIWEDADVYDGKGPVLYVSKLNKSDKAQEDFVEF